MGGGFITTDYCFLELFWGGADKASLEGDKVVIRGILSPPPTRESHAKRPPANFPP